MTGHILITGCSGSGKSTLIDALAARGRAVVPEPGLRIVQAQRAKGGTALPWQDPRAFLHLAAAQARRDLAAMQDKPGPVFYDRGLLDAAVGLYHVCGVPVQDTLGAKWPYARRVFVAPPWRAHFQTTPDRRHGFAEAVAEYQRITDALADLDCVTFELPVDTVTARVAFVERLSAPYTTSPNPLR